jgi:hypothetical protein
MRQTPLTLRGWIRAEYVWLVDLGVSDLLPSRAT